MHDPKLILTLVALSLFVGYMAGFAWRGSKLRKKRKARRSALETAAKNLKAPYSKGA